MGRCAIGPKGINLRLLGVEPGPLDYTRWCLVGEIKVGLNFISPHKNIKVLITELPHTPLESTARIYAPTSVPNRPGWPARQARLKPDPAGRRNAASPTSAAVGGRAPRRLQARRRRRPLAPPPRGPPPRRPPQQPRCRPLQAPPRRTHSHSHPAREGRDPLISGRWCAHHHHRHLSPFLCTLFAPVLTSRRIRSSDCRRLWGACLL